MPRMECGVRCAVHACCDLRLGSGQRGVAHGVRPRRSRRSGLHSVRRAQNDLARAVLAVVPEAYGAGAGDDGLLGERRTRIDPRHTPTALTPGTPRGSTRRSRKSTSSSIAKRRVRFVKVGMVATQDPGHEAGTLCTRRMRTITFAPGTNTASPFRTSRNVSTMHRSAERASASMDASGQ